MIKYYDILQIRDIKSAAYYLADEINVSREELLEILNLETLPKLVKFLADCYDKNYSAAQIISRKLNDIAIDHNLMVRFIPPKDHRERDDTYGL